jgi:hypothetical protein
VYGHPHSSRRRGASIGSHHWRWKTIAFVIDWAFGSNSEGPFAVLGRIPNYQLEGS